MKCYFSDVISSPQIGSGTEGALWAQELTLSEASPWAFCILWGSPFCFISIPNTGRSSSEILLIWNRTSQPKIAATTLYSSFCYCGNTSRHHWTPPVYPHSLKFLRSISCYDPIYQLRTSRLWVLTWPIRVETSVAVLSFSITPRESQDLRLNVHRPPCLPQTQVILFFFFSLPSTRCTPGTCTHPTRLSHRTDSQSETSLISFQWKTTLTFKPNA